MKKDAEEILVVPVHGNKPIKVGLLKGLIKDAGLTNEEFLRICYERRRRWKCDLHASIPAGCPAFSNIYIYSYKTFNWMVHL